MKTVIPLILWPAVAFSCFVYARRFYRRFSETAQPPPDLPSTTPAPRSGAGSVPFVSRSRPPSGEQPPEIEPSVAAALAAEGRIAPTPPVIPATPQASTPQVVDSAPGRPGPTGDDEPGRSGLFAKEPARRPAPKRALGDQMSGIQLPCGLAPLVSLDDLHRADIHAAFITKGHEPADVGRQLGDELERLGFTLSSVSDNQVLARRDDDGLMVTLHATPEVLEVDTHRVFPTAMPGDVIVEFDVD